MRGLVDRQILITSAVPGRVADDQRPEPYAELASEATFAKLDELGQFAEQRGISMAGAALAWLLGDERIGRS